MFGLGGGGLEWGGIFLLAAFRCDGPAVQVPSLSQFVVFSFAGPAVFGGVFGLMDSFSVCVCVCVCVTVCIITQHFTHK